MPDVEPRSEQAVQTPTIASKGFLKNWGNEIAMIAGGITVGGQTGLAIITSGREAVIHGILAGGMALGTILVARESHNRR